MKERNKQNNKKTRCQKSTFHWLVYLGKPIYPTIQVGFYLGKILLFSIALPLKFT